MSRKTISNQLIRKLMISFFCLMLLVGVAYVFTTFTLTNKYFEETTQKLNANVANHLIEEKFQEISPFDSLGEVNKEVFGDLMHDMMAVNRGIEVYLVDKSGGVLYSVVLDHERSKAPVTKINTAPLDEFIATNGQQHILGDDPRVPGVQKIFSAAKFSKDGHEGYIYIILASQVYDDVTNELFGSYFWKLGFGVTLLTLLFATIIGFLAIWYLTKNLREVIFNVQRFKEGDLSARIDASKETDLSTLAITFNQMADTIVSNIEQMESVEKLRRELVTNISHDLRSPMAIVQGYIETLMIKGDVLSHEEKEEYIARVHDGMQNLSKLVAQLFEYSKLEANQIQVEKEPFPIAELASDVLARNKILAEKKSIQLDFEFDKSASTFVFADMNLVERALQNLIDNALKFTPDHGKITLKIHTTGNQVEVMLADNGRGISEEDQKYIFERYSQAKKGDQQGAGLGLAIVKRIIELHESKVKVVSKLNEGASFQFWLPVYQDA